jgi:hypothetical protein
LQDTLDSLLPSSCWSSEWLLSLKYPH